MGACSSSLCLNGGTCLPSQSLGVYQCVCPGLPPSFNRVYFFYSLLINDNYYAVGFTGSSCQFQINCNLGDINVNQCKSWSLSGFCGLSYSYNGTPVAILCPISCRMCAAQCFDSSPQCSQWANSGYCTAINMQNNGICRKSCLQC